MAFEMNERTFKPVEPADFSIEVGDHAVVLVFQGASDRIRFEFPPDEFGPFARYVNDMQQENAERER